MSSHRCHFGVSRSLSTKQRPGIVILGLAVLFIGCAGLGVKPPDVSRPPEEVLSVYIAPGPDSLPGLAVSVIRGGKPVYQAAFGVRKTGDPTPVSLGDPFHIGSDTKAMTALLCGIAVDRGLLSWQSSAASILGARFPMRPEYREVTLELLLSHGAGLPPNLPATVWMSFFSSTKSVTEERERMARESLALQPAYPPGTGYLYSNIGILVAGFMIEKATGRAWEDLMRDELFTPLGMDGAGFGPPAKGKNPDGVPGAPWGHAPSPVDPAAASADNPQALGPAGTVHASILDLEKYFGLYARGGLDADGKRIISEASLSEFMRPRRESYSLGWIVRRDEAGRTCLTHDGSNTMFYSSFAFFPKEGDAVIVLTNRGGGTTPLKVAEIVTYLSMKFLDTEDRNLKP